MAALANDKILTSSDYSFDPMAWLPEENTLKILSYLDVQELGRCCQVNKTWCRIASDNALWRKLFHETFVPSNVNAKDYLSKHIVKPKNKVIQRIQNFANKLLLNKKTIATCFVFFMINELSIHSERTK